MKESPRAFNENTLRGVISKIYTKMEKLRLEHSINTYNAGARVFKGALADFQDVTENYRIA